MEKRFSQRNNPEFQEVPIQKESMNIELRNTIWNVIYVFILQKHSNGGTSFANSPVLKSFFENLYMFHLKQPIDGISHFKSDQLERFKQFFYNSGWDEVYDLVEFIYSWHYFDDEQKDSFKSLINESLEIENSAYRMLNGHVAEIVSKEEVEEVQSAIGLSGKYFSVKEHINQAVSLLSDRKNPDYRNSIKESISAVESLASIVVGEKGTLGQLIKALENRKVIPPSIKTAYTALYGYTSNEDGIRHAMLDKSDLNYTDARYMLIVCSAFVNYVIEFIERDFEGT